MQGQSQQREEFRVHYSTRLKIMKSRSCESCGYQTDIGLVLAELVRSHYLRHLRAPLFEICFKPYVPVFLKILVQS